MLLTLDHVLSILDHVVSARSRSIHIGSCSIGTRLCYQRWIVFCRYWAMLSILHHVLALDHVLSILFMFPFFVFLFSCSCSLALVLMLALDLLLSCSLDLALVVFPFSVLFPLFALSSTFGCSPRTPASFYSFSLSPAASHSFWLSPAFIYLFPPVLLSSCVFRSF